MESQIRQGLRVMFDDLFAEKVTLSSLYDVAKCLYDMQFKEMLQYPLTEKVLHDRQAAIKVYITKLIEFIQWKRGAEKMFAALMKSTKFSERDTEDIWTKKLMSHIFAIHPTNSIELYRERQWIELENQVLHACQHVDQDGGELSLLHWGRVIYFARQIKEQQDAMLFSDHQYAIVGLQFLLFALETDEESGQFHSLSTFPSHITLNCRGDMLEFKHASMISTYHLRIPQIVLAREQVNLTKDKLEKLLKLFASIWKVILKGNDEMKETGDILLDGILVTSSSLYVDISEVAQVYEERNGSEIFSLLQVDV